ncbi:prenyltransferase [Thiomicrorhabdus sp. 6S3-12]|uniref:prenyltransferase n=1 Tax=Thiomicrorhabdus sp. 6S3-12 TaxID=2819681 RepID=UPI001AAC5E7B|nr:prenyltransferase [Thiomicrorhabdus sp. 6S3-12]MBO1924938.1 prenyltransferase [Thiomicrorhabdus sp. 6S3-12]
MPLSATALSTYQGIDWHPVVLALLLLSALLAHAAVNLRNEIEDTESGLDAITFKTAFSGGSGALLGFQADLGFAERAYQIMVAVLLVLGLYFSWSVSLWLLVLGGIGLILIRFYTSTITRRPIVYWLAAGLGFGPVMLLGSYWVIAGQVDSAALIFALICFFLVNNLLLLNQLPDIQADRSVGRSNVWIVYGNNSAYSLFVFSCLSSLLLLVIMAALLEHMILNLLTLWAVPMLWMAVHLKKWLKENPDMTISLENLPILRPILAMNVIINLFFPLSIASVLMIGTGAV